MRNKISRKRTFVLASAALALAAAGCAPIAWLDRLTAAQAAPVPPSPTAAAPQLANTGAGGSLAAFEGTFESIYAQDNPSVVNIHVTQTLTIQSPFPFLQGLPNTQKQEALGSGFIWDMQGHIVTNRHVVSNADQIEVTFYDGTTAQAKLVGEDVDSDLAVIQVDVDAAELHPVQLANSRQLKVGQVVVAIGNPFGLQGTMTTGVISALERSLPVSGDSVAGGTYAIPSVIQTDASINPGNSGGILTDEQGQVIGVTSAIVSPSQASAGIGFAIPSAIVANVVPALVEKGSYAHPYLGISGTSLTADLAQAMGLSASQRGALVIQVVKGGPAAQAGLRGGQRAVTLNSETIPIGGDVIVSVNGQPVNVFADLTSYLELETRVGDTVELGLLRNGRSLTLTVTLAARPETPPEASAGGS